MLMPAYHALYCYFNRYTYCHQHRSHCWASRNSTLQTVKAAFCQLPNYDIVIDALLKYGYGLNTFEIRRQTHFLSFFSSLSPSLTLCLSYSLSLSVSLSPNNFSDPVYHLS